VNVLAWRQHNNASLIPALTVNCKLYTLTIPTIFKCGCVFYSPMWSSSFRSRSLDSNVISSKFIQIIYYCVFVVNTINSFVILTYIILRCFLFITYKVVSYNSIGITCNNTSPRNIDWSGTLGINLCNLGSAGRYLKSKSIKTSVTTKQEKNYKFYSMLIRGEGQ
jgi:hypothetical protein